MTKHSLLLLSSFFFLFSCLFCPQAAASWQWRSFGVGTGLPSSCVRDVCQDSLGYVYVATDGGLVRFDGRSFKEYPLGPEGRDSFVSRIAWCEGCLFVATDSHLYQYDAYRDEFSPVTLEVDGTPEEAFDVKCLRYDGRGSLWMGTLENGLYQISPSNLTARHYAFPQLHNYIPCVCFDARGYVYVVSNQGDGAVWRKQLSDDVFRRVYLRTGAAGFLPATALAMHLDRAGALWFGLWQGGLLRFDPLTGATEPVAVPAAGDHIHSIVQYGPAELLIGSDHGLTLYNYASGEATNMRPDELEPHALPDQFVYPIVTDREGGLWVGTYYGGLAYRAPDSKQFERHTHSEYRNSVCGSHVSRLAQTQDGQIWMATDDGGLCRYDAATGRFTSVELPAEAGKNVHALCPDGGQLWVGTYTGGVFRLDMQGRVLSRYTNGPESGSLANSSSYAICRTREGDIYVATMWDVSRYNRTTDNFTQLREIGVTTLDMLQDVGGRLWLATQGRGLFSYLPSTGEWVNYRQDAEAAYRLPSNHVNALKEDGEGTLWVATAAGLCRKAVEGSGFELVDIGRKANVMGLEEASGAWWLAIAGGVLRYSPTEPLQTYTVADGLTSEELNPNATLKAANSKIYLGTTNGCCAFWPELIKPNRITPSLVVTDLSVTNADTTRSYPLGPVNNGGTIVLEHDDYVMSLTFAALSFANPERNQYEYKLEGFDREWRGGSGQGRAVYTNLPPGTYKLLLRASNNDGQWVERAMSVPVRVLPAWWLTWWMKLLYIIMLLSLAALVVRWYLARAKERQMAELEHAQVEKERQASAAQLSYFTMVSHEIRTPVSLIAGPLRQLLKRPAAEVCQSAHEQLTVMQRNADRLLLLVGELLDFKKAEQNGLQLTRRRIDFGALCANIAERFRGGIQAAGGQLGIKVPNKRLIVNGDVEWLTKLVSNLLNNARKHTRSEVELTVGADAATGEALLSVRDDGNGIGPEEKPRIFEPYYQGTDNKEIGTGLGLSLVRKVAMMHGGSVSVVSELGQGATFFCRLPLERSSGAGEAEVVTDVVSVEAAAEMLGSRAKGEESMKAPSPEPPMAATVAGEAVVDNRRRSILVVDDEPDMLSYVSSCLSGEYDITTAVDGQAACEQLIALADAERPLPDMVVSDWMMPRMSGVDLCRRVRGDVRFSHLLFVLLTAKTDSGSKVEGYDCGADTYIEKPFSEPLLQAQLRNLLRRRDELQQRFRERPELTITSVAQNDTDSKLLSELQRIIDENLVDGDLSVDVIAEKLGMSRSSMYAKIKAVSGISPGELIQMTRLRKAAALLSGGEWRISEVGFMVGFKSASYFAKSFRDEYGVTPTEWIAGKRNRG